LSPSPRYLAKTDNKISEEGRNKEKGGKEKRKRTKPDEN